MAFRRRFRARAPMARRASFNRSPKAMNNGWVGAIDSFVSTTVLNGSWFTDIVFVPLLEVADYGLRESLDPDGLPTKQERTRVLKMVGDIAFTIVPGFDGSDARWRLNWYLARFGKEETDNAVGNSLAGGMFNYDPLQVPGPFLYMQQAILEHHQAVGFASPRFASGESDPQDGHTRRRFNKKLGLPLSTDDELYLVFAATIAQTSENMPIVGCDYTLRFLITD